MCQKLAAWSRESTKRRHHSPEWTILSHVNCFIQGEVQWFQVLLGSLHPRSTVGVWWSPPRNDDVRRKQSNHIFQAPCLCLLCHSAWMPCETTWWKTRQQLSYLYWVAAEAVWCALTMMNTCWNCDRIDLGVNDKAPGSWKIIVTMSLPMWRFLNNYRRRT